MKMIIMGVVIAAMFSSSLTAQTREPDPRDVGSMDGIMNAVYDVISGDMGKPRDWARFRGLFYKDARLIPTSKTAAGALAATSLSPDQFIERVEPAIAKAGFFEREIARRVEQYGPITHVFSTYESRHGLSDKTPFARGINSFQLLNDGKRWWVVTIYWASENPENLLPAKYLRSSK